MNENTDTNLNTNADATAADATTVVSRRGRPALRRKAGQGGYKVKIGLTYLAGSGDILTKVSRMADGTVYPTKRDAERALRVAVKAGVVKKWGNSVRAKFVENKGTALTGRTPVRKAKVAEAVAASVN